jgi:hypothetical protein
VSVELDDSVERDVDVDSVDIDNGALTRSAQSTTSTT